MVKETTDNLEDELEHFKNEKQKIRSIVGQIGGQQSQKKEKIINITFIAALVLLFILDILRHIFHIKTPIPALFSLEIGLLLVSIKIIWMIHIQAKVGHFQFWILNSIEFRLNDLSRKIKKLEKDLGKK